MWYFDVLLTVDLSTIIVISQLNVQKPNHFLHTTRLNIKKFFTVLSLRCFVRISTQTTTSALHVINWLVFITVVKSVYSTVRTDSLYTADYVSFFKRLIHKFLFYNKFIIFLYMFRALLCSSSGGQIVLYSIWYRHTCRWPSGAQVERGLSQSVHQTATYRCDDTRCCIIQFWPPDDEHTVLETCRGM